MASLFHVLCTSLLKILPDFVISRCWGGCKYFEIQSFDIQKQDMSWSRYHLKWNTYKHKRLIAYSRPDCIRRIEISLCRHYGWIFQTNILVQFNAPDLKDLKMQEKTTDLTSPSIVIPKCLQGFWNFVQILSRMPVNTACSHRAIKVLLCVVSNLTRPEQNKPRGQSYRSARTRQHAERSLKYGGEHGSIWCWCCKREVCRWIPLLATFLVLRLFNLSNLFYVGYFSSLLFEWL